MCRALILTLLCTTAGASGALAAWSDDPLINSPVCVVAGTQFTTIATTDGAGGTIVAWSDWRDPGAGIYAQRLNAAGDPQWTAGGVLVRAYPFQNPAIASDGAGGILVAWEDLRPGNHYDIYAQRVGPSGALLWNPTGAPVCTALQSQEYVSIVSDGAGGALLAWEDPRISPPGRDVYAQRLTAGGSPLWTVNGVALCTAIRNQFRPQVVHDGAGGAIVGWQDGRDLTYKYYAQHVNAGGTTSWATDGLALIVSTGSGAYLRGISDLAGGAIFTWDAPRFAGYDILSQRVNGSGTMLWGTDGVALCAAPGNQFYATLVPDGAGGVVAAWEDHRGATSDVYAQRMSSAGVPQWTANGVALCLAGGDQLWPVIASDGASGAVVGWEDLRSGTADVYAQRVSGAGAPLWTSNGVAVSTAANVQRKPTIAGDALGGAILAWEDLRSSPEGDIYAQWVDASGNLGGTAVGVEEPVISGALAFAAPAPNPARGTTLLRYQLPAASRVRLVVFDLAGRAVRSLADGMRRAGEHAEPFALQDDAGRSLPNGLYLLRLEVGPRAMTQRLAVMR